MADVPGAGGGKIRPKRSASSKKPYSRASSQRKSLFSRVTDSFKTFLNPLTPKWLSNRLAHEKGAENQAGTNQADPPSLNVNHQERQGVHTNNNYKRSPLSRPHLTERSSPAPSLKYFITPPDTPSEEQQPKETPTGGKQDLLKHLEMSSKRQKMSVDPSPSEKSNLTKEMIYLTTNVSDNASVASSSGCSSSAQANQCAVDNEGSQKNLWSSSMDSLASSRASSQQQVTMGSHKRPKFNPAIFSIPTMGSPSRIPDQLQSSFYQGPVQFGGANASMRSAYFATPYKVPSVTKVKVRHINHQRTPGLSSRSSSTSSKNSQSDLSVGGMSSTAKKILQTLEQMSSPLNDARKIPSVARTPSAFMAERQHRRRTIAGSSMLNRSLQLPPTRGLATPVSARIRKSVKMPLNNSLLAPEKHQEPAQNSDEKSASKSPPDSNVISTRGMPAPLASMSSAVPTSQRHSLGEAPGGGGKMKSQRRATSHYSAMHEEDKEEEEPDLPAVALPLTGSSNLPSFNFNKSLVTSTPALRAPNKLKDLSQPEFNFASPVVKTSNTDQVQTSSNTPKFQFSSPSSRVASSNENKGIANSSPLSNFNVGSKKTTPPLMFAPDPKVVSAVRASKLRSPPTSSQKNEEHGGFKSADSLKTGSVMDILAGKSTNTSKESENAYASGTPSIVNPIKQSKSGWECDTCLVQNDDSDNKCAACDTPKSGAKGPTSLSASQSNKGWECDTCLVPNDPGTEKCVACETPRPGSTPALSKPAFTPTVFNPPAKSSIMFGISNKDAAESKSKSEKPPTSWGSFAKKPTGEWECSTCLVSNEGSCDSCEACSTPRPGTKAKAPLSRTNNGKSSFSFGVPTSLAKKSPDSGKSSDITFGVKRSSNDKKAVNTTSGWGNQFKKSAGMWECEMCMVTNSVDRKTCEACESPKPGTEKQDSLNSSFKFGQASAGLFKFGIPDSKPVKDETKEKVQSSSENKITFGTPSSSSQSASLDVKAPPAFSFGTPSTAAPANKTDTTKTESALPFGKVSQSDSKSGSETAQKPLFSFGLPKTKQATPEVTEDKKLTEVAPSNLTPAAFGVPPPSYSNCLAKTTPSSVAESKPADLSAFKPSFGTSAPSSQAATVGFGVQTTKTSTTPPSGSLFTGFKTSAAETKPEEKKSANPVFSFGSQPGTASNFQFSGSSATAAPTPSSDAAPTASFSFGTKPSQTTAASSAPAPTFNFGSTSQAPSNIFGTATSTSSGTSSASTPFTGFGSSSQPTQQKSDSSAGAFKGFSFTGSQPASTTPSFGSNTLTTNDPSPFGSNNSTPSIFGSSKASSTPFGGSSTPGGLFGSGGSAKPAFGSTAVSDSGAGIPKPSFSFGQSTNNQPAEQKQTGFSGFQFTGSNPTNNSNTPSNSGFNFGAAASKPAPAFGSSNSAGFQFGASQQQSNGVFNFGSSSNQPKPEQQPTENKPGLFVFGGNAQAANNSGPQQASAGFSFGAPAPSSTGSFSFGGNQSSTPQGSSMFSIGEAAAAPPNQNPFSASVGRSTTPVQGGRRVFRQARRKLRK